MELTNKEIVQRVNDGFASGDVDVIMKYIADDVRWDIAGISTHIGSDAFRKEIKNDAFEGVPDIIIKNSIEEGDRVAVEGEVTSTFKSGQVFSAFFHNAYRLKDGKIVHLTSYLVPKNDVSKSVFPR